VADSRDPLVLRCPSCRTPLGLCDGDALTIGAARLTRRVSVVCVRCANVVGWRPRDVGGRALSVEPTAGDYQYEPAPPAPGART
jgi:hypothetical protein